MLPVLILDEDRRAHATFADAGRVANLEVKGVTGLGDVLVHLALEDFAGLIVRGLSERELRAFAHLSAQRPLPSTVIVSGCLPALSMRIGAAALVSPGAAAIEIVRAMVELIEVASTDGGQLPLRLVTTGAKWTKRLRVDPGCLPPLGFDETTAAAIMARGER